MFNINTKVNKTLFTFLLHAIDFLTHIESVCNDGEAVDIQFN